MLAEQVAKDVEKVLDSFTEEMSLLNIRLSIIEYRQCGND